MFAVIIQLPCGFHNLVVKTIILFVAWCSIWAAIAHHGVIFPFERPVVAPNVTLLFEEYEQNLRVYVVLLCGVVNNLRRRNHSVFDFAFWVVEWAMRLRIFVIILNADIWRLVVSRIARFALHARIFGACRVGWNGFPINGATTANRTGAPHVTSRHILIQMSLNLRNIHRVFVIKNRIIDNISSIKVCDWRSIAARRVGDCGTKKCRHERDAREDTDLIEPCNSAPHSRPPRS